MNITFASSDEIDQYAQEVDLILTILLGHTKALVTDSSSLFDFHIDIAMIENTDFYTEVKTEQDNQRNQLSNLVMIEITENDNPKIVDLAKQLRKIKMNVDYGPLTNTTDESVMEAGSLLQSAQHNDEI